MLQKKTVKTYLVLKSPMQALLCVLLISLLQDGGTLLQERQPRSLLSTLHLHNGRSMPRTRHTQAIPIILPVHCRQMYSELPFKLPIFLQMRGTILVFFIQIDCVEIRRDFWRFTVGRHVCFFIESVAFTFLTFILFFCTSLFLIYSEFCKRLVFYKENKLMWLMNGKNSYIYHPQCFKGK